MGGGVEGRGGTYLAMIEVRCGTVVGCVWGRSLRGFEAANRWSLELRLFTSVRLAYKS